jgi:Domain of unknown function (DUF4827)
MKQISIFLSLTFLVVLISSSCSNVKTFAQQLDDEQTTISAYVKRNNITVLSSFPTDKKWVKDNKDIYVKTGSGLYFHLVDSGDRSIKADTLLPKNTVIPRYKQYDLAVSSDTISNWNTIDYPYPPEFVYLDMTQSSKAFQEAVTYMKRNDSEAKIIVPFLLGFDSNSSNPYGFTLKIKILK